VASLKEGNSFGELALIESNGKRHATIVTESDTNLIVLKK
jgi:CRP-like cAMP-binding protein